MFNRCKKSKVYITVFCAMILIISITIRLNYQNVEKAKDINTRVNNSNIPQELDKLVQLGQFKHAIIKQIGSFRTVKTKSKVNIDNILELSNDGKYFCYASHEGIYEGDHLIFGSIENQTIHELTMNNSNYAMQGIGVVYIDPREKEKIFYSQKINNDVIIFHSNYDGSDRNIFAKNYNLGMPTPDGKYVLLYSLTDN